MPQWNISGSKKTGTPSESPNVVALGDRLRAPWCAPLRQLDTYWAALRRGRVVPARSDIDPRGIEGALEYAFVAEYLAPGHARMRIAGTHLCDMMGMEVRGMPVSAMMAPVSRERLSNVIKDLFDRPARVELALTAERRMGQPALQARMVLLPMTDDFGDISRILGGFVSDGTIGRAPRRFEITQADVSPLLPETDHSVGYVQSKRKDRQSFAMSEPAKAFRPGPVPYLRVVETET